MCVCVCVCIYVAQVVYHVTSIVSMQSELQNVLLV